MIRNMHRVGRRAACPLFLVLCAIVAGCAAQTSLSGGTGVPPTAASAASSPSATASSASAEHVPVLGQSRADTQGYGSVRPGTLNNGGDPTGIVTHLSWQSWGGPEAVGTGTGYYDAPNEPVAQATAEQATVVAFDLGTCGGQYMYQAVEWYFPESGGSFDSASYLDVCSWTYQSPG
jgi:hypothetical protein